MRVLALLALAGLGVLLAAMACIAALGLRERPRPADLIVVLGSRLYDDGRPKPGLESRLRRALEMWRAHEAPVVMVSGGPETGGNQAPAMAAWLEAHGVPARAIVVDPDGWNTWLTALHVRRWLRDHDARRVLAVSQFYHLPRCRLAFARLGVREVSLTAPRWWEPWDVLALAREVPAMVKYALRPLPRGDAR